MRREQLQELLREAGRVAGRDELVVIGSQAVHALTGTAPAEVVVSRECDLWLDEGDAAADALERQLGMQSPFFAERGVYVDVVPPGIPVLPEGWRDRLVSLDAAPVVARCLEAHDLAIAKLAAGRLKDYELVAALTRQGLVEPAAIRQRIASISEPRLRAILLARVQVAMESIGRS
ncbi:MAG TPA: DUF6036 family nucleotidyltransferase [Polyangiaceae bacterium]